MVELLKKSIKWIIIILIVVLGIKLLISASNSNKAKHVNKPLTTPVKTIKSKETEDETETTESISGDEYDTPDTASSNIKEVIIGLIILSGSSYYIVKNRLVEE